MDHRVEKVIALMEKYLHQGFSASRLAQFVNVSPSRLHQLFKEETGMPPAKYLHRLRMERAKELLENSYLSVKEVMARVGVADESHFVRDFKKSYGCTPAKYRERFHRGRREDTARGERNGPDTITEPPPSYRTPDRSARAAATAAPRAPASKTPPLLLRRASHPRHLAEDSSPSLRAKKRRELLSLVRLRHLAFAELTTRITDNLVRGLSKRRPGVNGPGVTQRLTSAVGRRIR